MVKTEGATAKDFAGFVISILEAFVWRETRHGVVGRKKNDKIAACTAALATKNEELAAKDEQMLRVLENKKEKANTIAVL